MSVHVYKSGSFVFYRESNLSQNEMRRFSIFVELKKKKFDLPIKGPNAVTNTALPIMCHPKAAGNCSNEQYSETVSVKFDNAIPT